MRVYFGNIFQFQLLLLNKYTFPILFQSDNLTALAKTYWAPHTAKNHVDYNPDVVEEIYKNDIKAGHLVNCKNVVFLFHLRPHDSVANFHYKYKKNGCFDYN